LIILTPQSGTPLVIDATNLIVGRLASRVAKLLLSGKKVTIINAENAVLSGKKQMRLREARQFLEIVGRANPKYGPKHPRTPDGMLRRTIRGMLPTDKAKGRSAFKSLRVYVGVPPQLQGVKPHTFEDASAARLKCPYVQLGAIAREIGWKGVA